MSKQKDTAERLHAFQRQIKENAAEFSAYINDLNKFVKEMEQRDEELRKKQKKEGPPKQPARVILLT